MSPRTIVIVIQDQIGDDWRTVGDENGRETVSYDAVFEDGVASFASAKGYCEVIRAFENRCIGCTFEDYGLAFVVSSMQNSHREQIPQGSSSVPATAQGRSTVLMRELETSPDAEKKAISIRLMACWFVTEICSHVRFTKLFSSQGGGRM